MRSSFSWLVFLLLASIGSTAFAENDYSSPSLNIDHFGTSIAPNERVDTFSGALQIVHSIHEIPGPDGFSLNVPLWYSSKINNWDPACSAAKREWTQYGIGWQAHWGRLWDNPADDDNPIVKVVPEFRLELPGGGHQPFYEDNELLVSNAEFVSPGNWSLRTGSCVGESGTCQIATSPDGFEYHFPRGSPHRMDPEDSYLYVATIVDPNGHQIRVDYDFGSGSNKAYLLKASLLDNDGEVLGEVRYSYTDGVAGPGRCSLDGASCTGSADCPNRCSGVEAEPCNHASECALGTCSDNGAELCDRDGDCDRNCSNNPGRTCTNDTQCGERQCQGGRNQGQRCTQDGDPFCWGTCAAGPQGGSPCQFETSCGYYCASGDPAHVGQWCAGTGSGCGGVCLGGRTPGQLCTTSCPNVCLSGDPAQVGRECYSSVSCGNSCKGGPNHGRACTWDSSCPRWCQGGARHGQTCSRPQDCPAGCVGGFKHGQACPGGWECEGKCSNDALRSCSVDHHCIWPGTCQLGTCEQGSCEPASCEQGFCELGICEEGSCELAECSGFGSCSPQPTCLPQPVCEFQEECIDNQCLPGETGPRYLDYIVVTMVDGNTATIDFNIIAGGYAEPVLASVTNAVGQTTSFDYAPGAGEQIHDLEIKRITSPAGGTTTYRYADHEFHVPLDGPYQRECTRVVTRRESAGGTWTFEHPSGLPSDRVTVVTGPDGYRTESSYIRYTAEGANGTWKVGLLERYVVKDVDTVLSEVEYSYEPRLISHDDVNPQFAYDEPAQVGVLVRTRTTFYGSDSQSKTSSVEHGGHDRFLNPAWTKEYDFAGSLYRTTRHEYAHNDDAKFEYAHIVNLPARVTMEDPSGAILTETINSYIDAGNGFGNLAETRVWLGAGNYVTTAHSYDGNGDPTEEVVSGNSVSQVMGFEYQHGTLKRLVKGGRQVFDRTIDPHTGLVTSETNANGGTTRFGYDLAGRITSIDPPGQDVSTVIEYGTLVVTASRGSGSTRYTFDVHGRLVETRTRVADGVYVYNRVDFDSQSRVLRNYEPSNSASPSAFTVRAYDSLGRVTSTTGPDGSTSFSYGSDRVTINDGVSTRTIVHDAFGRVVEVKEGSLSTSYAYDLAGNLLRVTHPGSSSDRTFSYNPAGWPTTQYQPESGNVAFGHDGIGRLAWKEDADGEREYYSYDAEGRTTGIDRPGNDNDVSFFYDGAHVPGHSASYENASGALTAMSDASGTTIWSRRDINERVLEIRKERSAVEYLTELGYDSQGNLNRVNYPHSGVSRTEVTYSHNAAGLVTGVWRNGSPIVTSITYNPLMTPNLWEYANGVTVQAPTAESERNRPTSIFTTGATRSGVAADLTLGYGYNSRGQVSNINFNGRSDTYSYEPARAFLKSVHYGDGGSIDYSYDPDGNMTQRRAVGFASLEFTRAHHNNRIGGCLYSSSGNLLECDGHSYTYSTNNRLRTADGAVRYTYDGEDRVAESLRLGWGEAIVDFFADPLGRLSRFRGPSGGEISPETDWIYAAGQMVATVYFGESEEVGATLSLNKDGSDVELHWSTPGGCPQADAVHRSGEPSFADYEVLANGVTHYYRDEGTVGDTNHYFYLVEPAPQTEQVRWYVSDHRGSTLMVLDQEGEVLADYEYFPFGGLKRAHGCLNLEGLYQGSVRDPFSDLFDLGVRHHSAELARFLLPDVVAPDLRLPSRWNLYVYAANDPVNLIDFLGYAAKTKEGGVNPLRDIDVYGQFEDPGAIAFWTDVIVNATGDTVSDLLSLDTIIDGTVVAGDCTRSPGERVWGGTKAVGITAFDAVGGAVVKRVVGRVAGPIAKKVKSLFTHGDEVAAKGGTTVIGKLDDLKNLRAGEQTMLGRLPNRGSPQANWHQNSGALRQEMGRGLPIRDASVDSAGNLINNTGFLRAERNLLQDRGWTYNPSTTMWHPPVRP